MSCHLPHIPQRLHSGERLNNPDFYIGELLYRRCELKHINNPFDTINLYDVSLNRQGPADNPYCEELDVLFNTKDEIPPILEQEVVPLVITNLNENLRYSKLMEGSQDDGRGNSIKLNCTIVLEHALIPCNYAHAVFSFYYDGQIVTEENYKSLLGKKNAGHSELRTRCKTEISKMILRREVRHYWQ